MICYPAILFAPDTAGQSGCTIPDLLVNASGSSPDAAIRDAVAIMTEVLGSMASKGEPFPEPTPTEDIDLDGGTLVVLTAPLPQAA